MFNVICDGGRYDGLSNFLHRFLEELTILGAVYRLWVCAEQRYPVGLQKALLCKLHREGKPRLTAKRRKQAVRFFLFNYSFNSFEVEGLDIYFVSHGVVRHYCGRIGVDKHDLKPVLF